MLFLHRLFNMKIVLIILLLPLLHSPAFSQKQKSKKTKIEQKGPKIFEVVGDSVRNDSVVYYETEIGYIIPDLSPKFSGKWNIDVMRRQARAIPDTMTKSYIEFYSDTLFTAFVGCNQLSGSYFIKGPTIKFRLLNRGLTACPESEIENWFVKLIEDRVSYFGIDEKLLFLKDVANNIVFECSRKIASTDN